MIHLKLYYLYTWMEMSHIYFVSTRNMFFYSIEQAHKFENNYYYMGIIVVI